FKEAIADFLKHTPCSEGTHLFLHRLRDDPVGRIDGIWQGLVDSGQSLDGLKERVAFVGCLRTVWKHSEAATLLAAGLNVVRAEKKYSAALEKFIAKTITDKKAARKNKIAFVTEATKHLAEVDKVFAEFDSKAWDAKDFARFNIRSDRDGSRQRTAFMRGASGLFHETIGEWCDGWV